MAKCPSVPPSPVSIDVTISNGAIPWISPTQMADIMRERKALSLKTMTKINRITIPNAKAIIGIIVTLPSL